MDITAFPPVPIPASIDATTPTGPDNRHVTASDNHWGILGQAREKLRELLHESRLPDTPPAIILSDTPHILRPSYEHLLWSISSTDAIYTCQNTRNIPDEKSSLVTELPEHEELDHENQHSAWSAEVVEHNIHRAHNILTAHHIPVLIAGGRAKNLHTTCLATLAHLSYNEPVKALGFPVTNIPMISDEQWITDISTMRDIMSILRPAGGNSRTILEKLANPTLCVLSGLFAYAAARGIPIIISDLVSLTAAILADDLAPGAHRWYIIGTSCPYPVYAQGVQQLFSTPHLPIECQLPSPDAGIFFYQTLKLTSSV